MCEATKVQAEAMGFTVHIDAYELDDNGVWTSEYQVLYDAGITNIPFVDVYSVSESLLRVPNDTQVFIQCGQFDDAISVLLNSIALEKRFPIMAMMNVDNINIAEIVSRHNLVDLFMPAQWEPSATNIAAFDELFGSPGDFASQYSELYGDGVFSYHDASLAGLLVQITRALKATQADHGIVNDDNVELNSVRLRQVLSDGSIPTSTFYGTVAPHADTGVNEQKPMLLAQVTLREKVGIERGNGQFLRLVAAPKELVPAASSLSKTRWPEIPMRPFPLCRVDFINERCPPGHSLTNTELIDAAFESPMVSYHEHMLDYVPKTLPNCTPCSIGTIRRNDHYLCSGCPPGSFNNRTGQTECVLCLETEYQDMSGANKCKTCPAGMYSDEIGRPACKDCTTIAVHSELSRTQCGLCPGGMFPTDASGTCADCPLGLDCVPGRDPRVLPGYVAWRTDKQLVGSRRKIGALLLQNIAVSLCLNIGSCPGGNVGTSETSTDVPCTVGGSKVACASCIDGYYFEGGGCQRCTGFTVPTVVLIIFVTIIVRTFYMKTLPESTNYDEHIAMLSSSTTYEIICDSVFGFFQLLWLAGSVRIVWPELLSSWLSWPGDIASFSFVNVHCVGGGKTPETIAVEKVISVNLVPMYVLMFMGAVLLARPMIQRVQCRKKNRGCPRPETYMVTNFLFMYFESFFLVVLANAINFAFSTYPHPTHNAKSLLAFPFILSSGDTENWAYTYIVVVSIIATLVWGAGSFFVLLLIIKRLRTITTTHTVAQNRTFIKHVIIIFLRYRDEYYYWPMVTLVQKLLFNLAMVIWDYPERQLAHMVLVTVIFLVLTMKCRPYRSSDYYRIDVNIQCSFILLIVFVLASRNSTSTESPNMHEFIHIFVLLAIIILYIIYELARLTWRFKCKPPYVPSEKELNYLRGMLRARKSEEPTEEKMHSLCKQLKDCTAWVDLEARAHSDRMDNRLPILLEIMDETRAIFTPILPGVSLGRTLFVSSAHAESKDKEQSDDNIPITPMLPRLLASGADANKNKVSTVEMKASDTNMASVDAEDSNDRPMAEEEKDIDDQKTHVDGTTL
eukprot:GEMP01006011.1.p1 GENE.GEMP01006011.1~~GEMP01006011.1.p1  ORF type:complete len:1075 (+),score=155.98 GEMP01006011.1:334-3558(+)